jgi:pseudouridine-5'-phosphate glycosidase
VRHALAGGKPVVALESTIISHGMPYPRNVEMATEVEGIVRDGGATPATIAVLDGVPTVGLTPDQLEVLASDPSVAKVSLRDLPHVIARRGHGATTVASTMRLAALAGIPVFVTGGLGGVHRGATTTMDISADLTELAQTDVAVISAGVKSILDIGLTL